MPPQTSIDFVGTLASAGIGLSTLAWMVRYFMAEISKKDEVIKLLIIDFKADIKALTSEAKEERARIVDKFTGAIDRLNSSIQEVVHIRDPRQ